MPSRMWEGWSRITDTVHDNDLNMKRSEPPAVAEILSKYASVLYVSQAIATRIAIYTCS